MIDLGLEGKHAIVSGAGRLRAGHGRLSAIRLAEAGATVACIDIDEGRAKGTVSDILLAGGRAFPVIADMTDPSQVERAIDDAVRELGGIDVCVDIVGGAAWERAEEFSDADWEWTMLHNVTHVFYLFRAAGRRMKDQGTGGALVALASVDGIAAARYHAPYGAAKAGVMSLVKSFGEELGHYGIRVNAVAPGNVGDGNEDQPDGEYDVNGINPLAAPRNRDIANAVLFLSSALAERITGQTLVVDGGATIHSLWGMKAESIPEYRSRFG
jgi:NAD(P)-dependent dehydrogenase (short-subunit alcohol dehydrogenase family)